jgi:hypothetical protein
MPTRPQIIVMLAFTLTAEFGEKVWLAFWAASVGGCVSLVINWVFHVVLPRIRRLKLTRKLSLIVDPKHGEHVRLRVINEGFWTMEDTTLYLALEFNLAAVLPEPGLKAHITVENFVPLSGDQLCWSVRAPGITPIKVPIYAGERQPFSLCRIESDRIVIPSEEGWPPNYARVFLRPGSYIGNLRIVSKDTTARLFHVRIDPQLPEGCAITPFSSPRVPLHNKILNFFVE